MCNYPLLRGLLFYSGEFFPLLLFSEARISRCLFAFVCPKKQEGWGTYRHFTPSTFSFVICVNRFYHVCDTCVLGTGVKYSIMLQT